MMTTRKLLPHWGSCPRSGLRGCEPAHLSAGDETPSVSVPVAPIHLPHIALRAGGGTGASQ